MLNLKKCKAPAHVIKKAQSVLTQHVNEGGIVRKSKGIGYYTLKVGGDDWRLVSKDGKVWDLMTHNTYQKRLNR